RISWPDRGPSYVVSQNWRGFGANASPRHWKGPFTMQILLRRDVEKLGEAGTMTTVKNAYARNFLIPQGLAVSATPGELKMWEHNQAVKAGKVESQERELPSFADKIAGVTLTC